MSEETKNQEELEKNESNKATEDTDNKEVKVEEPTLEEKYNELNDKYLRLYSEFDNFRRRTAKERLELFKTAGQDILTDLLPIMDDFERALTNMDKKADVKTIRVGVDLVYNKFKSTLTSKGLESFKSIDKEFNPDYHEAVTKIPAPSKKLKGKVIDEIEKGYKLSDKVIRFAKVVVGE